MLELAKVRATAMESSVETQKEHYDHRNVNARTMPDENSPETTGNGYRIEFLMSRMLKMEGLVFAVSEIAYIVDFASVNLGEISIITKP